MLKNIYLYTCILFVASNLQAQIIFEENFESGTLDSSWEIETFATDGGWLVGTPNQLSSQFFTIPENSSSRVIGTNDDGCNCNKSNDRLITPAIDLSGITAAVLSFELFYGDSNYQGAQERASVNISTDKLNWTKLKDLRTSNGWKQELVNLTDYIGQTIYLSFDYSDDGGWVYGCFLDDIKVSVPLNLDAALIPSKGLLYGETGSPYIIPLMLFNRGASEITQLDISYSINGGAPIIQSYDNLSIAAFDKFELAFNENWMPEFLGTNLVKIDILSTNGTDDDDLENNFYDFEIEVYEKIERMNIIDEILESNPTISEIANFTNQLNNPTDLDFFPILGKNELWVLNQRNESDGGSTVKIQNANTDLPEFEHQVDGNSWHFMSLPTAIDFSTDNHNFATTAGVQDANHSGGTFTGPTLWSSDPTIYAKPSGGNGSHLDMLHGSPFSMGIAHEKDNAFWVYDDWNKDIVRYDFVDDHGPGNDDHSD